MNWLNPLCHGDCYRPLVLLTFSLHTVNITLLPVKQCWGSGSSRIRIFWALRIWIHWFCGSGCGSFNWRFWWISGEILSHLAFWKLKIRSVVQKLQIFVKKYLLAKNRLKDCQKIPFLPQNFLCQRSDNFWKALAPEWMDGFSNVKIVKWSEFWALSIGTK